MAKALRVAALIAGSLLLAGVAMADPIDRSKLSYDDNVTINAACDPLLKAAGGAYDGCVKRQLDALESHPAPDRSGLPASRAASIEHRCAYLRVEGIAEYNGCLTRLIAEPAPAPASDGAKL